MDKNALSIAILARDEERLIGACLESTAGLAGEVVVLLDHRSCDRTGDLCRSFGATVSLEPWRGYAAQRNRALYLCQNEWVLFLDADERLTPELQHELRSLERDDTSTIAGYFIPRYNVFFNRVLRGGGWYPDFQLRLLRRAQARYDETQLVHEVAILDGPTACCRGHFLHINIEYLGEFWQKQTEYALSEARTLAQQGRRTRARNFVGAPAREFWRRYIRLGGWCDGWVGGFLCGSLAWFEVVKFGCLLLIADSPETHQRERDTEG